MPVSESGVMQEQEPYVEVYELGHVRQMAIGLDPLDANLYHLRAVLRMNPTAYYTERDPKGGRADLKKAKQLDPNHPATAANWAVLIQLEK